MSQTKAQLVGGVGFSTADSLTVYNGVDVTGVVTATSFSGDGSGLTGVANTAFVNAEQVTVVGVVTATTFDGNLTGNVTGTANLASGITGVPGIEVGIITATSAALTDNISAASGTFTGNVTVGGTLTYDDVTNIDSIGVVTARTGVDVVANGVDIAGGGLAVTGIATFNDNIVGDNSTNISGINSVTATAFYGDGSGLTGVSGGGGGGVISTVNDGATGRLDPFGSGNFRVFYEPGTFDTAGITSMRVRVVGAGSSGHMHFVCYYAFQSPTPASCSFCNRFNCPCSGGGGAGGGYTHKVFAVPEVPGGTVNVQVGTPWSCGSPSDTVGTSCFGADLYATGGVERCGIGTGFGGDVNYCGGVGSFCAGGAAGSQLGNGCPGGRVAGTVACWNGNRPRPRGIERFPFDTFTGKPGRCIHCFCSGGICESGSPGCGSGGFGGKNYIICSPLASGVTMYSGCYRNLGGTGGGGGTGGSESPHLTTLPADPSCRCGGDGGFGAGGGGEIFAYNCRSGSSCGPVTCAECKECISSGAGGPGIVIVEW